LENKHNFDIRIYFYDDNDNQKSLLCNSKSSRKYKTSYKFIILENNIKLRRGYSIETKYYKIWYEKKHKEKKYEHHDEHESRKINEELEIKKSTVIDLNQKKILE